MSTPISGSGDNLDSAAILKLMLEALSKASAELDRTVDILTEQLSGFNQNLDKSLRDELSAARDRMDAALRQNQERLHKDKEAVIKSLSEFKQAEIEKVILTGKTVRTGLAAQVEEAGRDLASTVAGKIAAIKGELARPELEMKEKFEQVQQGLQAAVSEAQDRLSQKRAVEEAAISKSTAEFQDKVIKAVNAGSQSAEVSLAGRRAELESEAENVGAELAQKYDEVIARLENSLKQGQAGQEEASTDAAGKLKQISDSGGQYFSEQEKAFQESLSGTSELLNGLFETRLNNLVAQSRTEIVSAAQHANECLATTRTELHGCLNEFQKDYVAQFETLHARMEQTLDEYGKKKDGSNLRGVKEERVREQLHNLFRRLGQEMVNGAAMASRRLEADFQKSMDAFEHRIESAKTQACESLTRESNLMQKEMDRSFQEFEKQVADLQSQSLQLEKTGRDAANFVMTIRQANLNF
jgi:hypothetical protein